MAFLDNSGDIILDAVLTDTGRFRLAKGDGSFKISKFALGDDEIDYSLYKPNHSSGSAYYDLQVLQSPVFEAFTNNTSAMKSFLISISRTNLLYLPVIKQNAIAAGTQTHSTGYYVIAVNKETEDKLATTDEDGLTGQDGILFGENVDKGGIIRADQGIDNSAVPATLALDADLRETQYIVQLDHRLGTLCDPDSGTPATPSFIDDDFIASYYFSLGGAGSGNHLSNITDTGDSEMVIAGSRGTSFTVKIQSSLELNTSTYLFTQLGGTTTIAGSGVTNNIYNIDTTLRIQGATTGYVLDLPLRFARYFT